MSDKKTDKPNETPAPRNADLDFQKEAGVSTTSETLEREKLKELILRLLPEPPHSDK